MIKVVMNYIGEYVREECVQSRMGQELYDNHLVVMANYAGRLAVELDADREVVELSSFLHCFAAVTDFENSQSHTLNNLEVAHKLLSQFHYTEDKIKKIKLCLKNYGKPLKLGDASREEVCVSNAEMMSQIARPVFWLYFGYTVKKRTYQEGLENYIRSMDTGFRQLIPQAKVLVEDKYAFLRSLRK